MTPPIGSVELYKTSGHWEHYKENMFPAMELEGETFVLKEYKNISITKAKTEEDCDFASCIISK